MDVIGGEERLRRGVASVPVKVGGRVLVPSAAKQRVLPKRMTRDHRSPDRSRRLGGVDGRICVPRLRASSQRCAGGLPPKHGGGSALLELEHVNRRSTTARAYTAAEIGPIPTVGGAQEIPSTRTEIDPAVWCEHRWSAYTGVCGVVLVLGGSFSLRRIQ